jgi:hypothetical protein
MADKSCPNCQKENPAEAAFCIFCGIPLEFGKDNQTTTTRIEMEPAGVAHPAEQSLLDSFELPEQGVALYLRDYSKPIAVRKDKQFVIGRKMTEEATEGFVDLVPYGGYENGVSQKHALVRQTTHGWEIIDLGSTNGTWLDKRRLMPNQGYPLPTLSQISLGRMFLYIYVYETSENHGDRK